jgi:hypothetical protein
MVEDAYGRDPAIRFKQTRLLAIPRTMISKRIEDGESVSVADLFDGLAARLKELIEDGWTWIGTAGTAQSTSSGPFE